jgi:peptidoglycan L-alanyl-D-glutamate endopeptidase CwlK
MNNFKWGARSLKNLSNVHPDLVAVCNRALEISEVDMVVIEGLRSKERQKELVAKGASKTLNSRHITGHAVDIAPWPITWEKKAFIPIVEAMKQAADELGIDVVHGHDWGWDSPHHELSRKTYP